MALYATERIDDAVSLTRSLLFPFDAGLWARLAVVVFFLGLGSGGNVTSLGSNTPSAGSSAGSAAPSVDFSVDPGSVSIASEAVAALAALAVVLVAVWLALAWLGATLEFVFVEGLSNRSVAIRRGLGRHWGRGLRLFGFRLALLVLSLGVLGATALALFWGPITTALGGGSVTISDAQILVGLGALLFVGALVGLPAVAIHWLTTELVVPIMLARDRGVLAAWRGLLAAIRTQWKQFGAYLLVAIGLRIATSVAAGIVLAIVGVVLAIPFLIVGLLLGLGAVTGGTITAPLVVGIVLLAVAFVLVLALAGAVVHVPIESFHRYFALLFVGDLDNDFDVVGEIRPPLSDDSFGA
ncbi:DUF7544 domain-containing protein [Halapricum hydrolyticum]|uniref:Uncharacterized protein n=1 Tax=Halapricum hydrolyticum TaxID=2979991 RepID=A0AAE3LFG7_9EURY|nr:hypothetical protein [Halapricum hydrolyticum]MCU4718739.1 hypothetical protein [Halapricum hydrolyticum]MCU4727726.1 hypothetical protein [Halapricum hydrolyticum]